MQIYSEAIVVVQLSGSLLNSTYVQNSELHAYLPEGWEEKLDSLIDNAYTYGREGISTAVCIPTLINVIYSLVARCRNLSTTENVFDVILTFLPGSKTGKNKIKKYKKRCFKFKDDVCTLDQFDQCQHILCKDNRKVI